MEAYAGIDLHARNNYTGVINGNDRRLFGKRLPNRLDAVLEALEPFREELVGVVVESTYNWYWLVDGLSDHGHRMHLANPSAIKQYEGLKHTDDRWDSFWLAHMLRLGILPEGYIYPQKMRPVRDLLRRRLLFVGQRTAHLLSLQSMIQRHLARPMSARLIKQLTQHDLHEMFDSPHLRLMASSNISAIEFLTERIRVIEGAVRSEVELQEPFKYLVTIPGIGLILGLTIMLEVGEIGRFSKVGDFCSYCRCVQSQRLSDQRKKGEGNRKNGNKYLAWAYVEASHFAITKSQKAQRFYQRKKAKTNGAVATKALSNKLARASYYLMRDQIPYDGRKLFG
jgi:transposase